MNPLLAATDQTHSSSLGALWQPRCQRRSCPQCRAQGGRAVGSGTGWLQGMWGHLQPPSLDVGLTAQRTRAQGACCFVPSVASVSPFVPTLLLKGPGGTGQGSGTLGPW